MLEFKNMNLEQHFRCRSDKKLPNMNDPGLTVRAFSFHLRPSGKKFKTSNPPKPYQ